MLKAMIIFYHSSTLEHTPTTLELMFNFLLIFNTKSAFEQH